MERELKHVLLFKALSLLKCKVEPFDVALLNKAVVLPSLSFFKDEVLVFFRVFDLDSLTESLLLVIVFVPYLVIIVIELEHMCARMLCNLCCMLIETDHLVI